MSPTNVSRPLVLVTGASGYIAGHCIRELFAHGYRVRGTVRYLSDRSKVAHLDAIAREHGGEVELREADLSRDDGWSQAVAGCDFVLHVASPFPARVPKDEYELITPAVEGTRRVLRAAVDSGTVRRVVMTSSVAAIAFGHTDKPDDYVFTEADWSVVENCAPYQKSKTLAERAAWDFVASLPSTSRIEFAVINPGFVLGPLLNADPGTSGELVRKLMTREMPAVPEIGFAPVDVRDVATAHRLALETPGAAGNRYICAGEHVWTREMAIWLAEEFGRYGYRVPTGRLPYWLMWLIARFDEAVRLALGYVGHKELVSADKAKRELGWTMRPIRDTVIETAYSMIEHGVVPRKGAVPGGVEARAAA